MNRAQIVPSRPRVRALVRKAARTSDAQLRTRYLIIAHSARGHGRREIARMLGCCESTVTRVRQRFLDNGEAGLIDRREDNGSPKVDERFMQKLAHVLSFCSWHWGHRRPTWTQPLLTETMAELTGIRISLRTMGRLLKLLGVRRGRPKPTVRCPWGEKARRRRLKMLHRLIETLPEDEVAVWEDEADIDLNPRIGCDYMLPGTQRQVVTPGKNIKRYLAGSMDAQTQRLIWVKALRKNSALFIELLKKLLRVYADKRVIHVIVDNYTIHSSRQTQAWLAERGERIRLHFLPPYCPDDNRIERCVWRETHANVTYNHRCRSIDELMGEVAAYLTRLSRRLQSSAELRAAI